VSKISLYNIDLLLLKKRGFKVSYISARIILYTINREVGALSEIIVKGRSFIARENLWDALR